VVETIAPALDLVSAVADDSGLPPDITVPLAVADYAVTASDIGEKVDDGKTVAAAVGLTSAIVGLTVEGTAVPIAVGNVTVQGTDYVGTQLGQYLDSISGDLYNWFVDESDWWTNW
jgi:hypothetical protein